MGVFSWRCMTQVIAIFDIIIDCFYLALWSALLLIIIGVRFLVNVLDKNAESMDKGWIAVGCIILAFLFAIGILLFLSGLNRCLAVSVKRCFIFVAIWVGYNTFWFFYVIYITFFKAGRTGMHKGTGITVLLIKAAFMGPAIMYGLELRKKMQQVQAQPPPGDAEGGNPEDPEAPIPKHQQAAAEEEKS